MVRGQLTLNLQLDQYLSFSNFIPGANTELVHHLQQLVNSEQQQQIYIFANHGSGKTHLLTALCQLAASSERSMFYIDLAKPESLMPEILQSLEHYFLLCVDNLQGIAGLPEWEEAFFGLFNRKRDSQGSLVITADRRFDKLPIELADVRSRLSWGVSYQLQALSDEQKQQALFIHAKERGMHLSSEVLNYIFKHYSREMPNLMQLLEQLDKRSLAEQRRITVPFLKQVLDAFSH